MSAQTNTSPGLKKLSHVSADGYEVQCSADPITAESWENCPATGKAKFTLTEQPTLTKRWARARAFRSEEKGPWSDSAPALVP